MGTRLGLVLVPLQSPGVVAGESLATRLVPPRLWAPVELALGAARPAAMSVTPGWWTSGLSCVTGADRGWPPGQGRDVCMAQGLSLPRAGRGRGLGLRDVQTPPRPDRSRLTGGECDSQLHLDVEALPISIVPLLMDTMYKTELSSLGQSRAGAGGVPVLPPARPALCLGLSVGRAVVCHRPTCGVPVYLFPF